MRLSYLPVWPQRQARSVPLDLLAERLRHVRADDDDNDDEGGRDGDDRPAGGDMVTCRYCGSTIAAFVRTCPFCRRPLWGV